MPDFALALAGPFPMAPLRVLGFTIEPFGVLTVMAIVVGVTLAHHRARDLGLSPAVIGHLSIIAVVAGFTVSHLVYVVGYDLESVRRNPLYLLMIWDGMSNVGGWFGGYLGVWLYFRWNRGLPFLPYADAIAYGLAFAWIFGRLGCVVSFDHPGPLTDFFLGMEHPGSRTLEAGVRHNVGLYEFLWAMSLSAWFFSQRRTAKVRGWYAFVFLLAYLPFRLPVDFLRVGEARYAGLSPAQWILLAILPLVVIVARWSVKRGEVLAPDGVPKPDLYPGGVVPPPAVG